MTIKIDEIKVDINQYIFCHLKIDFIFPTIILKTSFAFLIVLLGSLNSLQKFIDSKFF